MLLDHWPNYPLQIRHQCFSVFRQVELNGAVTIFFVTIARQEIEGVVPTGSEQDGGTHLSIFPMLCQFVCKVNEFVYELEKFWWVWHVATIPA